MGGKHASQRARENDRRIAAEEHQARMEVAQAIINRLPGHLVEIKEKGTYTALEVNTSERIVYCWRPSEPNDVWPFPFRLVILPRELIQGPMPPLEEEGKA